MIVREPCGELMNLIVGKRKQQKGLQLRKPEATPSLGPAPEVLRK